MHDQNGADTVRSDGREYWKYGYGGADTPSDLQRALLSDVVRQGSDGNPPVTVAALLERIEKHEGVLDFLITDRFVQINTVYTNGRNELLGIHLMKKGELGYVLLDADPFDLYAYGAWDEELDERLEEIARKHGLTVERAAVYCVPDYAEVERQLEDFYAFWQELDALE